jgi:hypothetical protein
MRGDDLGTGTIIIPTGTPVHTKYDKLSIIIYSGIL